MFIDTIQIKLLTSMVKPRQLDYLLSILKLDKEILHKSTGYVSTVANYKNLKITINDKTIHVNGSLPKFYFGDNVQTFTSEQQVNEALKQLSTELGLPILKGDIVRLDVAISVPLLSNIPFYMKSLKETPGYGYSYNEGRYINKKYTKGNLVLAFYDKTSETNQYTVPSAYTNRDVIRVELRIMKNVRKTLNKNIPRLLGVHLLSNTFKVKLIELFSKHYEAIIKKEQYIEPIIKPQWKAVKELFVYQHIAYSGTSNIVNDLKLIAKQNQWPSNRRSEIIKNIKYLMRHSNYYVPNRYVAELNAKFHDTLNKVMPYI